MLKKQRIEKPEDVPENWKDRVLVIWEEDDVNYEDKENTAAAFRRIAGRSVTALGQMVHEIDEGDVSFYFYRQGWVRCSSYDGGFIGVLVQEEK